MAPLRLITTVLRPFALVDEDDLPLCSLRKMPSKPQDTTVFLESQNLDFFLSLLPLFCYLIVFGRAIGRTSVDTAFLEMLCCS